MIFRLLLGGPGRGVPVDLGRFGGNFRLPFGGTFGNKASLGTENSVPFAPSGSRDAVGVDFWQMLGKCGIDFCIFVEGFVEVAWAHFWINVGLVVCRSS